jgi:hypothetical protein
VKASSVLQPHTAGQHTSTRTLPVCNTQHLGRDNPNQMPARASVLHPAKHTPSPAVCLLLVAQRLPSQTPAHCGSSTHFLVATPNAASCKHTRHMHAEHAACWQPGNHPQAVLSSSGPAGSFLLLLLTPCSPQAGVCAVGTPHNPEAACQATLAAVQHGAYKTSHCLPCCGGPAVDTRSSGGTTAAVIPHQWV